MATDGIEPEGELLLTEEIIEEPNAAPIEPVEEIEYPDTLDDAIDPAEETPLIKQLREQRKEDARKLREKDRELQEMRNRKPVVRTDKPTLESCEWDEDKLADQLIAWKDNERAADEAERAPATRQDDQAQAWQQELQAYKTNATKLGKPDFQAAEDAVVSALSDPQQNTIVMAAKDPARFIYALGKSPIKLAQLAEITNPIKLAAEVARIEGLRTMARKEPANIDTPLRGNAPLSSAPKNDAETKATAAAEKSGDVNALLAARRERRAKAA